MGILFYIFFTATILSVTSIVLEDITEITDITSAPSNSVITIQAGTYTNTHFEIIDKSNITISSNGQVIIQQCNNPMIIKDSDDIRISNILIRDCSSGGVGGAINVTNSHPSIFRNVTFISNTAVDGGAMGMVNSEVYINSSTFTGNYAEEFGGAIISIRSSLFIAENTLINENTVGTDDAVGNGGGVYVASPVGFTVRNTNITKNTASHLGGGIFISPSALDLGRSVEIVETDFLNNKVFREFVCDTCGPLSGGAAIYGKNVTMNIDRCKFNGNNAIIALSSVRVMAGGILVLGSRYGVDTTVDHYRPTLTITKCDFGKNVVRSVGIGSAGGAVFAGDALLEIDDCTFTQNFAGSVSNQSPSPTTGGAICYESGMRFYMTNTFIDANIVSDGIGGAIYITNSRFSTQENVTYSNNRVISGVLLSSKGGALFAVSGEGQVESLTLNNCSFHNNTAEPLLERDLGAIAGLKSTYGGFAGALYLQSVRVYITHCYFERNVAYNGNFAMITGGGAVVLNMVVGCDIRNSTFNGNYALGSIHFNELYSMPGLGGAILSLSSSCDIDNTTFKMNLASASGSVDSDYNSVQPSGSGGAIAVLGTSFAGGVSSTISNSHFRNNFVVGNLCHMTSSIPSGSAAALLSMESENNLRIENTTFYSNVAVSGLAEQLDLPPVPAWGGAIAYSRSPLKIINAEFKNNLIYGIGYGIDLAGLPVSKGSTRSEISIDNTRFERGNQDRDVANEYLVKNVTAFVCNLAQQMQAAVPDTNTDNHHPFGRKMTTSNDNIDSLDHLDPLLKEHHMKRNLLHAAGDRQMKALELKVLTALHSGHERGKVHVKNTTDTYQQLMHSLHLLRRGVSPVDKMPVSDSEEMDMESSSSSSSSSSTSNSILNEKVRRLQSSQREMTNSFNLILSLIARNLGVTVADLQLLLSSSVSASGSNLSGGKFTYTGPLNFFVGDEQEFMNIWLGRPVGNDAEGTEALLKFGYANYTHQHGQNIGNYLNDMIFISAVSATVNLDVDFPTIPEVKLTSILAIDATYIMKSSHVWIENVAALAQATIAGEHSQFLVDGVYTYNSYTIDIANATISNRGISRFTPSLDIENCTLKIRDSFSIISVGTVAFKYTLEFLTTLNVTEAATVTFDNATLHILESAQLRLRTSLVIAPRTLNGINNMTTFESQFINDGDISIGGIYSLDTIFAEDREPVLRPGSFEFWSRTTPLFVFVPFINTGNIYMYLGPADNSDDPKSQRQPALFLISNESFSGHVFVTATVSDQSTDGLTLYSPEDPSEWEQMVVFNSISPSVDPNLPTAQIISTDPDTVITGVTTDREDMLPVRADIGYSENFVLQKIACESINTLYADIPSDFSTGTGAQQAYACDICLRNSSCSICPTNCITHGGTCSDGGGSGVSDCCGGCRNEGVCRSSGTPGQPDFSFECHCTFLYTGDTCNEYSDVFYVIAVLPPALLIALIALWLIYRSRKNYKSLRRAMRDGILGKRSGVSKEHFGFFSALQQDLVLNELLVDYNELILEQMIGEGAFGIVYAARYMNERVALKKLRQPMYLSLSKQQVDAFKLEAYTMTRMRHPNIVLVMGIALTSPAVDEPAGKYGHVFSSLPRSSTSAFSEADPTLGQTVCILTEFLDQGSLADLLHGDKKLPESAWTYELALRCALQAARGMLYLHSRNPPMIHRDLKSANLVVNSHWVVKVTDFGMSRILPRKRQATTSAFENYNPFGFGTSSDDRTKQKEERKNKNKHKNKKKTISFFDTFSTAFTGTETKSSESTEGDEHHLSAQEEEALMSFDIRQTYSISGLGAPELASERVRTVSFDEYATTVQGMQLKSDHTDSYGLSGLSSFSFSGWEAPEASHDFRNTISGDVDNRHGSHGARAGHTYDARNGIGSRSNSRSNSIGSARNPLHSNVSTASTVQAGHGRIPSYQKFGVPIYMRSSDAAGRGPQSDLKKKLILNSESMVSDAGASNTSNITFDSDIEAANAAKKAANTPQDNSLNTSDFNLTARLGTPAWAAPELNASHVYGTKVDIFSFGMVMWELVHRKRPYEGYTSRFDIEDAIARGERPPVSPTCPYRWKQLMEKCWQGNPALRPPFKDIVAELEEMLAIEAPLEDPNEARSDGQKSSKDSSDKTFRRSRAISITSPLVPNMSLNGVIDTNRNWSRSQCTSNDEGEENVALLSVVEGSEQLSNNNNSDNGYHYKQQFHTALRISEGEAETEDNNTLYSDQSNKSIISEFAERTPSIEEKIRVAADSKINEDEHLL